MAAFIEKLKNFGASLKRTIKSTAKKIAEKTPEATETLTEKSKALASEVAERAPEVAEKTKKVASAVAEKTEEAVTHAKLRLKLYNLNKSVEKKMGEMGSSIFELISQGITDVYEDSDVKGMIDAVTKVKKEIKETEQAIEDLSVEKKAEQME